MRTVRTYTDDQRTAALAIYKEQGLGAAWRQTGIPKQTIATWAEKAGVRNPTSDQIRHMVDNWREHLAMRREQLRVDMLEKAADILDRMDREHIDFKGKDADQVTYPIAPANAVKDYAIAFAILVDKFRLEMGEATGRTEMRSLTDGLDDHEKRTLRDFIDGITAGDAEEPADPSGDPRGAGAEVRQ